METLKWSAFWCSIGTLSSFGTFAPSDDCAFWLIGRAIFGEEAATMRGSHLDRDDPQPPDGCEIARRLERELDLAIKERDEAVQLFTQELNKAVERIKSHGTSPKSRT